MKVELPSQAHTEAHAAMMAKHLSSACVFVLRGELGAGKTTWVRAFLRTLGHDGVVPSPTYTLVEPYEVGGVRLWHVDLYRLQDPLELEGLGLREMLDGDTVLMVEWPQRCPEIEAGADVRLDFLHGASESARHLEITAVSERGEVLLAGLDDGVLRKVKIAT